MEKWNAYTRDGQLTDTILIRGEIIPQGLYFMACGVLVRHVDGSFLCMRRAKEKEYYGGCFEATAHGAAQLGENKYECVKRELEEETGLRCDEFMEIGSDIDDESQCIFYGFVCNVDCDKNSVRLQEGETEGYVWMDEAEFTEFVNSGKMIPNQYKRYYEYFKKRRFIR